jgi:PAS domain-containing protein
MEPMTDVRAMPSSDVVFGRVARRMAARSTSPRDLQAQLRAFFPRAVVRERGLSHEPPILYIYRDGRYERDHGGTWWASDEVPTVVIDVEAGTIVEASPGLARLVQGRGEDLVGRPWTDLVGPDALEVAQLTVATILELGEATSEALLCRSDGSPLLLEFHASLADGRIEVAYRPVAE